MGPQVFRKFRIVPGKRDLVARTYLLDGQHERIGQIALELNCGVSEIVRALLDHALADLDAGRLELLTEVAGQRVTGWRASE